jgi:cobalt-zinc-cadmium resistance protein CzcA
MPISISAAVGFITLSGVSVLSSMVLVSAIRNKIQTGIDPKTAVYEACVDCMRTVCMTALVASVGFLPMAVSSSLGAEVQRPLATVVIGGVVASMITTMFVLPVLCTFLRGRKPEPPLESIA